MTNPKLQRLERVKEAAFEKAASLETGTPKGDRAFDLAMEAAGAVSRFRERLRRESGEEKC